MSSASSSHGKTETVGANIVHQIWTNAVKKSASDSSVLSTGALPSRRNSKA